MKDVQMILNIICDLYLRPLSPARPRMEAIHPARVLRLSSFSFAVVTRYYRELLRFLQGAARDRETAADIAQESYARLLAVQQSGETVAEPRALLYRTARNLLIDQHRRGEVRGAHLSLESDAVEDPIDLVAGPQALEPEAAAMSAQSVDALLAAIGALPLRCREAFMLHKFDGLSQAEVARQMGISVTMVERHIKLGMQACRACQDNMQGGASPASAQQSGVRK
ncbi:sigma-70 family RNA polymerase sigma factor [Acidovorax sp. CCYZU-2555]|uniref:RNA polymerase sigma factor n=1 Tax=Acidovorax sp. CCYZU-2555 TaxID=2835042 RepID=UPI0032DF9FF5